LSFAGAMSEAQAANKMPAPVADSVEVAAAKAATKNRKNTQLASVSGQTANNKKHTAKHSTSSHNKNNNNK